ncbi:hypothetical protein RA27_22490 [Ruegeria sp. ANG-R]|uniref:type II toxin-antitoxin system RelE/ParE family toxin n=1 Tax=Ruegeria sp. ANG-R TaxID=1577903 RepID=UPI00057E9AA7|nr:type II toxin-antitoxin system RelE/ParE family toxin [Ruegeria sp. ANG-R]KIC35905.1 hypothetical protein RA27_22490 [Ruegeria sp. ANG-R]
MAEFLLTPRALSDLDAIAEYTIVHWGRQQAETYISDLISRMEWLAADPNLGTPRDEVAPGYRSFPQGQHVLFYLVDQDHIAIIGIPHKSMDIEAHLI